MDRHTYSHTIWTNSLIAKLLIGICSISSVLLLFDINILAIPNLFNSIIISILMTPILILIVLIIDFATNKQIKMLYWVIILLVIIAITVWLTLQVKVEVRTK